MSENTSYDSFRDFYPYYLNEHSNPVCRALHYIGTTVALSVLLFALLTQNFVLIIPAFITGYAFAWVGHFFFEHNKPATFQYPLYSFMGDWVMLKDFLRGRFRQSFPGDD